MRTNALFALLYLVASTAGCIDYTSRRCKDAADCTDLAWDQEDCMEADGFWQCLGGECVSACSQTSCRMPVECTIEPWPSDAACSEAQGHWECVRDPGVTLESLFPKSDLGLFANRGERVLLENEADLLAQINGAAPQYLDRGWQRGAYQQYFLPDAEVVVFIHDMGTRENARAIYDFHLTDEHTVLWDDPDLAAAQIQLVMSYAESIMAVHEFYVVLTHDNRDGDQMDELESFARAIADAVLNSTCQAVCDP